MEWSKSLARGVTGQADSSGVFASGNGILAKPWQSLRLMEDHVQKTEARLQSAPSDRASSFILSSNDDGPHGEDEDPKWLLCIWRHSSTSFGPSIHGSDLPAQYGLWSRVSSQFSRQSPWGMWDALIVWFGKKASDVRRHIDDSYLKLHQHSLQGSKLGREKQAIGLLREWLTRQRDKIGPSDW